jgi:hypothetical protein
MNQDPQIIRNTAFLTVFSFCCASFIWVLVLFAASVGGRFPFDNGVWLLWVPPILAWAGLAGFGLIQRRRSAQGAGIAVAALILPFLCGGSWGLLLTLILTHD